MHNIDISKFLIQIVWAFSNTVEAKDKYTGGHSMRVADYTIALCQKAGKSDDFIQNAYTTALLHDIGKIGVPDVIINKPGKLTEEEFAIMKQHPIIGNNILKVVTEVPDIATGARWHHERWDGNGYPDGLKEFEIPEIARIICVADAYDAMTSARSYRDIMPQKMVKDAIYKGMGSQFDPDYASLMLQIIEDDMSYNMRG